MPLEANHFAIVYNFLSSRLLDDFGNLCEKSAVTKNEISISILLNNNRNDHLVSNSPKQHQHSALWSSVFISKKF